MIRAVVFDLDGTLVDSGLDFAAIRAELCLGPGPVLEQIERLDPDRRVACHAVLDRHELAGADRARPFPGVVDLLERLDRWGMPRAVFTRNSRPIAERTLRRCGLVFGTVLTRDDGPIKPDPACLLDLAGRWAVPTQEILLVGDYLYDVQAGRRAGCPTALVTHRREWDFAHLADHRWASIEEGSRWLERNRSARAEPGGPAADPSVR